MKNKDNDKKYFLYNTILLSLLFGGNLILFSRVDLEFKSAILFNLFLILILIFRNFLYQSRYK